MFPSFEYAIHRNSQRFVKTRSIVTCLGTDRKRCSTLSKLLRKGNVPARYCNRGQLICEFERFDGSLDRVVEGVGEKRRLRIWSA